jgi:16S rRNA (adenine(1408)-N(1))-methyltransferase
VLVIGLDANADLLRQVARRARAKPSRGGVPNAIFGRLALEQAPGALVALAHRLSVLLPWGSLLGAVAHPDRDGLTRLAALCREGAEVRIVFGYSHQTDPAAATLDLPPLEQVGALARLKNAYREAGFAVTARYTTIDEVAALPTTWAKKLAYSGKRRIFTEILGVRLPAQGPSTVVSSDACAPRSMNGAP